MMEPNNQHQPGFANIGDLAKPIDSLVNRVSDAIGAALEPRQMRRIAKAKGEIAIAEAQTEIEISDLHRRALARWVSEEAIKQHNIETITQNAQQKLKQEIDPTSMSDDWIRYFVSNCSAISDQSMQDIWSELLATQSQRMTKFSKRSIATLATMNSDDARLLEKLAQYKWTINGTVNIIISNTTIDLFKKYYSITHTDLNHLEYLGLISYQPNMPTVRIITQEMKSVRLEYYGYPVVLMRDTEKYGTETQYAYDVGMAQLTQAGAELITLCEARPDARYCKHIRNYWKLNSRQIRQQCGSEVASTK